MPARLEIFALPGMPTIQPGDNLASMIAAYGPKPDDIIVVAQKVISKAEGRIVTLSTVSPSPRALELSHTTGKDPRVVELVLQESANVIRAEPGLMIVEHRLGFVLANAGIDASNAGGEDQVILLPAAPDETARQLRQSIKAVTGADISVIITDSWGRAWRLGTVGFAIGVAGVPGIIDMCDHPDLDGRPLQATTIGIADELAAAASLLMGQADEGQPVVVIRGLRARDDESCAVDLLRPTEQDLFR